MKTRELIIGAYSSLPGRAYTSTAGWKNWASAGSLAPRFTWCCARPRTLRRPHLPGRRITWLSNVGHMIKATPPYAIGGL